MICLNFNQSDKDRIESAENKRGYTYYDFTEESCRAIAATPLEEITADEWRSLVQMLYPQNLICSGLFDPFLVFEITESGKRKDPPKDHFPNLNHPGSDGVLLERIAEALKENGITVHETWGPCLEKIKKIREGGGCYIKNVHPNSG